MCIRDRFRLSRILAGRNSPPSPVAVAIQVGQNTGRLGKTSHSCFWCSSGSVESWYAGTVLPLLLLLQFRFGSPLSFNLINWCCSCCCSLRIPTTYLPPDIVAVAVAVALGRKSKPKNFCEKIEKLSLADWLLCNSMLR